MKKALNLNTIAICSFFVLLLSVFFKSTVSQAVDIKNVVNYNEMIEIWVVNVDDNDNIYLLNMETYEVILEAMRFNNDGDLEHINLIEYAQEINYINFRMNQLINKPETKNSGYDDNKNFRVIPIWADIYTETSQWIGLGDPIRVTAFCVGCHISTTQSASISQSFGGTISLNATLRDRISTGASFSWNSSATRSSTSSYSWQVPTNMTGHIEFTPRLNVTQGVITRVFTWPPFMDTTLEYRGSVWGASPIRLSNGQADGTFRLVYRR